MRILTLLTGVIIGGGTMIWFYTAGGEISVAGRQWGPAPVAARPVAGPVEEKAAAPKPRVVIRDITEGSAAKPAEPARPNPPVPAPTKDGPPAGADALVVIKWPYGDHVTKLP